MKKVFLILTLFVTSFFFVSLNEVSAKTYSYEITSDNISLINGDFYTFREKVIEHCSSNNLFYVILYNIVSSKYSVYFIDSMDNFKLVSDSSGYFSLIFSGYELYKFENNDLTFESSSESSSSFIYFQGRYSSMNYHILDSNFDLIYTTSHGHVLNITYKDFYYSISPDSCFPTFYNIYLEENPLPADPFEEEKGILNNFYTTILTKISDLSISFASNYIFILIFGIFILIFVFELIWRRFI